MKQQEFVSGWKRQPEDFRDLRFTLRAPAKEPAKTDLSALTGPVFNQGSLGSCTANAIASAIAYSRAKKGKPFVASRLFIYYNERVRINTVNEDSGAVIRDGFKSINQEGACKESVWPYVIKNFAVKPSAEAYRQALENQSVKYYAVAPSVDQIKQALIAGFPVVFGFDVFQSFFKVNKSKPTMKMPAAGEQLMGGHAVIIVGYNNRRKAFRVQNSWGANWADGGFFWMPYTYVSDTEYTSDFWVLEEVE